MKLVHHVSVRRHVRCRRARGARRGRRHRAAWMAAVESHCVEAALALIAAGANVTSRSNRSTTALHVAATWSHEAVNALIKAGADVNARNEFNRTPIFYALDLRSLPLLLEAGADIEARDHLGRTPVVFVASFYDPRWSVADGAHRLIAGICQLFHEPNRIQPIPRRDFFQAFLHPIFRWQRLTQNCFRHNGNFGSLFFE
ncbi:ankyrin repeat domain-containing protein [bacterium]|nr:ankyrin repeat domain-containing protein [bacterium]